MLLSIVMPVYNTDPQMLQRSLNCFSDISENMEIIIVDDGTTNSMTRLVLDCYRKQGNLNWKIITQKNRGVSGARSKGIQMASGKWITFCDADDEIDLLLLCNALEVAESSNADIIYSDYQKIANKKEKAVRLKNCSTIYDFGKTLLTQPNIYGTVWGKIFKTTSINKITFDEDLTHCEDTLFLIKCLSQLKSVAHDTNCFYRYYVNKFSSAKQNTNAIDHYLKALEAAETIIQEEAMDLKRYLYDFYNTNILIILANYIYGAGQAFSDGKQKLIELQKNPLIQQGLNNNNLEDWKNNLVIKALNNKLYFLCFLIVKIRALI